MNLLKIKASPHIHEAISTREIMVLVIAALLPSAVVGVIQFGVRALVLILFCTVFSVAIEALCRVAMKREQTIGDCSAALTGLLLALNLPVTLPLWEAAVGCFIAVAIIKQLFGGLGQNFVNPAITARVVLMVSFTSDMTNWILPKTQAVSDFSYDAISSATPLVSGNATLTELLWGSVGGCLGETCAAALLFGGLFLIFMGVISPVIPFSFLGTVAVCTFISGDGSLTSVLYQLLAGGLMLGAFFMATDYVTSPITTKGKLIFGIGCGLLTFLIRTYGSYPEGVSLAILLMNILVPYIDKFTMTHPLGAVYKKREAE